MGVELTRAEIEDFLTNAHTLIVSTIGKDGVPHAAPLWFNFLDGAVYFRSMSHQQKAVNLARNPKVCLLVEDGEAWVDLRAVMLRGEVQVVEDEAEIARFNRAFNAKYAAYRRPDERVGEATLRHYSRPRTYFRLPLADARVTSWYNRKVRLRV
jgi:PPOX class probable F420-dependent enzyme